MHMCFMHQVTELLSTNGTQQMVEAQSEHMNTRASTLSARMKSDSLSLCDKLRVTILR